MKSLLLIAILLLILTSLNAEKIQDFSLQNTDGEIVKLSDHLGKGPVLISFWATWCKPCLKELPKLDNLLKKFENLTILAISTDKPKKYADVKALVKSYNFSFITLLDSDKKLQQMLNISAIPRTFILDKDGEIIYDHTGYTEGDELHLEEVINNYLKQTTEPEAEIIETDESDCE